MCFLFGVSFSPCLFPFHSTHWDGLRDHHRKQDSSCENIAIRSICDSVHPQARCCLPNREVRLGKTGAKQPIPRCQCRTFSLCWNSRSLHFQLGIHSANFKVLSFFLSCNLSWVMKPLHVGVETPEWTWADSSGWLQMYCRRWKEMAWRPTATLLMREGFHCIISQALRIFPIKMVTKEPQYQLSHHGKRTSVWQKRSWLVQNITHINRGASHTYSVTACIIRVYKHIHVYTPSINSLVPP